MKEAKILERLDAASGSLKELEQELRSIRYKDDGIDRGILYHNKAGYCPYCHIGTYWNKVIVEERRISEVYHCCRLCLSLIEIKGARDDRLAKAIQFAR